MTYQLIASGEVIAEHPHKLTCWIEAIEGGYVMDASADFAGDASGLFLMAGMEIKEKSND